MMDYEEILRGHLAVIKAEGRYRTFANNWRTRRRRCACASGSQ